MDVRNWPREWPGAKSTKSLKFMAVNIVSQKYFSSTSHGLQIIIILVQGKLPLCSTSPACLNTSCICMGPIAWLLSRQKYIKCKIIKCKDKYKCDAMHFLNNASEWKNTNTTIYIIIFQYRLTNRSVVARAIFNHDNHVDRLRRSHNCRSYDYISRGQLKLIPYHCLNWLWVVLPKKRGLEILVNHRGFNAEISWWAWYS